MTQGSGPGGEPDDPRGPLEPPPPPAPWPSVDELGPLMPPPALPYEPFGEGVPAAGTPSGEPAAPTGWARPDRAGRSRTPVVAIVALLVVVITGGTIASLALLAPGGTPQPTRPDPAPGGATIPGDTFTIGISLAMEGGSLETTDPIRAGVQLAVDEANERGLLPGVTVRTRLLDHGSDDWSDTGKAAADMATFIDDPTVVGVVGPFHDDAAEAQIPLSNAAGLLQCSPSNITTGLTIGPDAAGLRPVPERASYVRVQPPEDREGAALAAYAWETLGLRHAAVGDDGSAWGTALANTFTAAWAGMGGSIDMRFHADPGISDIDVQRIANPKIDVVVFGGVTSTGALDLRLLLDAAGRRDRWLLVGHEAMDGGGSVVGSFANRVRDRPAPPGPTAGADAYRSTFFRDDAFYRRFEEATGIDAGYYGAAGYACAEAILEGIRAAREAGAISREAVRAAVVDPAASYPGVFGPTSFDRHGDIVPSALTIYRFDPAADGEGNWTWETQVVLDER